MAWEPRAWNFSEEYPSEAFNKERARISKLRKIPKGINK